LDSHFINLGYEREGQKCPAKQLKG